MSIIPGWKSESDQAAGRERRVIHFPAARPEWGAVARRFLAGELKGLLPFHQGATATVLRGPVDEAGTIVYVKISHPRNWRDWLKLPLKRSRSIRALRAGHLLEQNGLHVPEPLFVIEHRKGGVVVRSILATREAGAAQGASRGVLEWLTDPALGLDRSPEFRRQFAWNLGLQVGQLHNAGFCHGDLRFNNMLVEFDGSRMRITWLDNESTVRYRGLPLPHRIRNLAQLDHHPPGRELRWTDRMRFFRSYRQAIGLGRADGRQLLKQVLQWSRVRWRKRGWI